MPVGFPDLYTPIYQHTMKIAISWQEILIFSMAYLLENVHIGLKY